MEKLVIKCSVCGNDKKNRIYTCKDRRMNVGEKFRYLHCAECGTLSLCDIPEDMERYYSSDYYSFHLKKSNKVIPKPLRIIIKFFTVDFWLPVFVRMILRERIGTTLLLYATHASYTAKICDVGGGNGAWAARLMDWGFCDVKCVDQFVSETPFPDIKFSNCDFIDMEESIKYDFLTFHHSFEHMSNPNKVLEKVNKTLKRDGTCVIRVPICDCDVWEKYHENWFQIDPPRHYFLYTKKAINLLCERNGLRVSKIVYDSGYEQYIRSRLFRDSDISFNDAMQVGRRYQWRYFLKAWIANIRRRGDQAAFYIKHAL